MYIIYVYTYAYMYIHTTFAIYNFFDSIYSIFSVYYVYIYIYACVHHVPGTLAFSSFLSRVFFLGGTATVQSQLSSL